MKTFEIVFEGVAYNCRPTFRSVASIEQALGKSIYQCGMQLVEANLQVRELVVIIKFMLETAGVTNVSPDRIGAELIERGPKSFVEPSAQFCIQAFAGPGIFDEKATDLPLMAKSPPTVN